jgi:hypothetical protein
MSLVEIMNLVSICFSYTLVLRFYYIIFTIIFCQVKSKRYKDSI